MLPWASMLEAAAEHAEGDVLASRTPLRKGRGGIAALAVPADVKPRPNAKRRRQRVDKTASARRPRVKANELPNMDEVVLSLLSLRQSQNPPMAIIPMAGGDATVQPLHNSLQQRFLSPHASQIKHANHSMSFILNGGASLEDKGGLIRLPKLPPFQAPHASHRSTSSPNQQGSTTDERTRRVLQDQLDTLHQLRYEYHDNRPSHLHRSEDMVDEDDDRWDSDDSYDDVASTSSLDPNHRSSLGFSDTSGVFRRLLPSSIHDYDDAAHPSSSKHQAPFSTSWAQRKRNFELLQVTARLEDARQDYLGHIHSSLEEDMRVQHHYQHLHPHAPLPTDAQVMAMRRQRAREVSMMYLFETNCRNAYEIGAFAFNHTTTSNVFKDSFSDVRGLLAALEAVLSLRKCWIVHVETIQNNELGDDEDVMTFHVGFQVYVRDNVGACKALLRPELHWLLPHLMHARERGFVSVQAALQCRYRTFDVKSMYIHVDVAALVHSFNIPTSSNPDNMDRMSSTRTLNQAR